MPSERPSPIAIGSLVDCGRLEILSEIGKGAFGAVYCAQDVHDGSLYAVKCLLPNRRTRKGKLLNVSKLFEHEAKLHAAASGHDNVLTIHKAFVENGLHFLVFDLCEGGDLLSNISGRPFFWRHDDNVKRTILQIIDGVSHIHEQGIAHRDLKPENIIALDANGEHFVISDFGLATAQVETSGFGIGSKYYKSPECSVPEEGAQQFDSQVSDVWALGVILVNMITGSVPWAQAHPFDEHYAAYIHDRNSISRYLCVSNELLPLLKRVLEPHPRARISLAQFREELESIEHFHPTDDELAHAPILVRTMMAERAEALGISYALPARAGSRERDASPPATATLRASDTPEESELYTPSEPAFSVRPTAKGAFPTKDALGPIQPYLNVELDSTLPNNAARIRALPKLRIPV